MAEQLPKEELLRKALKWALKEGVGASIVEVGSFYDMGCGCCAGDASPPEDIRLLVIEIQQEIISERK